MTNLKYMAIREITFQSGRRAGSIAVSLAGLTALMVTCHVTDPAKAKLTGGSWRGERK